MNEEEMVGIIERFNSDSEFRVSQAFQDGGIDPLFGRLHRTALAIKLSKTILMELLCSATEVRSNTALSVIWMH